MNETLDHIESLLFLGKEVIIKGEKEFLFVKSEMEKRGANLEKLYMGLETELAELAYFR